MTKRYFLYFILFSLWLLLFSGKEVITNFLVFDLFSLPFKSELSDTLWFFINVLLKISLLLLMIFALTEGCNVGRPQDAMAPLFIGLTVSSIICLIAPLTQAGLNPARDFGPRIVAWATGWGSAAFPDQNGGFFFVYILGPILGGILASLFFVYVLEPVMNRSSVKCDCKTTNQ